MKSVETVTKKKCGLNKIMAKVRDKTLGILENQTIADLVTQ